MASFNHRLGLIFVALAATTVARPAAAGDGAAAAEVMFSEGKRLAQEGNYAAACPQFEESQKLDPGVGTLYRLADCYERIGRTASAWAAFLEVASSAKASGQQARADDAKSRASALESTLSRLVIRVVEPSAPALVVKRGDVVVGRAQWGTSLPVDPGEVAVEASAPGRASWRGVAVVPVRGASQIDIPVLEAAPAPPPTALPETKAGGAPDRVVERAPFGTQRTIAVVAGATAVVALGIGTIFGLRSMSKKSSADEHCDATGCDDQGLKFRRDAFSAGNLSTVGFIAGGALAASALTLWFTAPSRAANAGAASNTPRIGLAPRWGGLSFEMELR